MINILQLLYFFFNDAYTGLADCLYGQEGRNAPQELKWLEDED
jgi:hypothetical protein